MEPRHLVRSVGGFARRSTLIAAGATPRQLATAVHRGDLIRPRRGVYAHPDVSPAQVHAAAHGGAVTCGSALAEYGVWLRDRPSECVVLLDQGHALPHRGCQRPPNGHRRRSAPPFGLDDARSALGHYLLCVDDDEARACAVESCLARGLVSREELDRLPNRLTHRVRSLLTWCRSDAGSGLETMVRRRLALLGIDAQSQVELPGVGAVDLMIGDRLVIELDGREHHRREVDFHRDRERDAQTVRLGGTTLRFSSAQVLHDIDGVIATILAAMARGEHLSRSILLSGAATRRHG